MKLEGLKVVDLSWFLPGPYLTTALADHLIVHGQQRLARAEQVGVRPIGVTGDDRQRVQV